MQKEVHMSLESLFRDAVNALRERNVLFAVAGGMAANLYRIESRLTMDVDFVIMIESHAMQVAISVLESIGLEAGVTREADLAGGPMFAIRRGNTKPCMVIGRRPANTAGEGIDIILPSVPWAKDATRRAQDNLVDYGFGPIPVLTVEDIILSKLYALSSSKLRAKDLDDLQSIYELKADIDSAYLSGQMRKFKIMIPKAAEPFLDDQILKVARDMVRTEQ